MALSREYPKYIGIEISNICNAKCLICPQKNLTRKNQFMEFNLFKKIINLIRPTKIKQIFSFGIGEPFLHPSCIEFLRYMRQNVNPAVRINITTNGSFLNESVLEEIIQSGLIDEFTVSMHGGTAEAYEISTSLEYNTLIRNINKFIVIRNKSKKKKPALFINSIYMPENLHSIESLEKNLLQADRLIVSVADNFAGKIFKVDIETYPHIFICKSPFENMVVMADGKVALCCYDSDGAVIMGDLNNETIEEVWRGDKFTRTRKAMAQGDFANLPLCSGCTQVIKRYDLQYLRNLCLKNGMDGEEINRLLSILYDIRIRNNLKYGNPIKYYFYQLFKFMSRGRISRRWMRYKMAEGS